MPAGPNKLTADEYYKRHRRVIDAYNAGKTGREIAAKMEVPKGTIHEIIHRAHLHGVATREGVMSAHIYARKWGWVARERAKGKTLAQIGEIGGFTRQMAHVVLKRLQSPPG